GGAGRGRARTRARARRARATRAPGRARARSAAGRAARGASRWPSCRAPDRAPDEPLAEVLEADPGGRGGLREEARRGEPRDRVDLEHEDLPGLVDAEVDARD